MILLELYNLKLHEYKQTGLRERPWKLLAMLLLSEKEKYEALIGSQGEFYEKYKANINKLIAKVEKDFNFTREEIIHFIKQTVICDNYDEQKIWFVFAEGFGALNWGLRYKEDKTAEEIYSEYFDSDDLKKYYDLEQKTHANNITPTKLDKLLDKILENPEEFYIRICKELSHKERNFIISQLENKSCQNCTNRNCPIEYGKKAKQDSNTQGSNCYKWYNPELIGKSKVLRKTNIYHLK